MADKIFRCNPCNRTFDTAEAKAQHKIDAHMPHRRLLASERPKNRGPVPCAYPGCEASFKNEWACTQHRIAAHNEGTPVPSDQRGSEQ